MIQQHLQKKIGIDHVIRHEKNTGYGGNQKTCYNTALKIGADIVIMVHPDYQYTPKLIPSMVALLDSGLYECVIGSRILGKGALKGGMPLYKYIASNFLYPQIQIQAAIHIFLLDRPDLR